MSPLSQLHGEAEQSSFERPRAQQDHAPSSGATAPGKKPWIVGILVGAVAIGGGAYAMASHKMHAPTAESVRDVPQREGNAIVFSEAFAKRAGVKVDSVRRAPLVPRFVSSERSRSIRRASPCCRYAPSRCRAADGEVRG